jgi:phage tail protein X
MTPRARVRWDSLFGRLVTAVVKATVETRPGAADWGGRAKLLGGLTFQI